MTQYQVPQFIEVEDKLFGPLTFKQFIYLIGSGGFTFVIFRSLPFFFAVLIGLPVVALGLALAFYKPNNKPFIFTLEAALKYFTGGKLYIWKKEKKASYTTQKKNEVEQIYIPKLSNSKLSDLAWDLDVKEKTEDN